MVHRICASLENFVAMTAMEHFKAWLVQVTYLTPEDCALFEPHLRVTNVGKGQRFAEEGRVARDMAFVHSGGFRTFYHAEGKEINTHFAFEEDFVTEYDSFLDQKPSRYTIEALEDAEIITFDLDTLKMAYGRSHNWERFGRTMAEHAYRSMAQRVESFLFLNGEERYLELLRNHHQVFDRVPLYHIASYLGMERESLSRLRGRIAHRGRL